MRSSTWVRTCLGVFVACGVACGSSEEGFEEEFDFDAGQSVGPVSDAATISRGDGAQLDAALSSASDSSADLDTGPEAGNVPPDDAAAGAGDGSVVPFSCATALPPAEDLELWLKAGTGITLVDGRASRWADQSKHEDVVQGDANRRPALEMNAINGKPVLHFDNRDSLRRRLPVEGLTGLSVAIVTATPDLWKPGREWCQTYSGCTTLISETGCSSSYQYVINWHGRGSNAGISLSPKQEEIGYRVGVGGQGPNSENSCKLSVDPMIAWRRPASIGKSYSSTVLVHDANNNRIYVDGQKVHDVKKREPRTKIEGSFPDVDIGGSPDWEPRSRDNNQIAEVLIYKAALSDDKIKALDAYLNCQFFPARITTP